MKKFLLILATLFLVSDLAMAQEQQTPTSTTDKKSIRTIDNKYRDRISKMFSAKMYQDPYVVSKILTSMANKKKENYENIKFDTFFTKQDELRLKKNANQADIKNPTLQTDLLQQKIWQDPQGSMVDAVMSQEIHAIKSEEVKELSKVDKSILLNFTQMITESGPELGKGKVPVQYDNS